MEAKAVVTGMGVATPLGNTVESFWEGMCAGRSGVRLVDRFDLEGLPSKVAGLAEDLEPEGMTGKDIRRRDRYTLFALGAADQAWAQSGIDLSKANPQRCGAIVGSGIGGFSTIEEQILKFAKGGPRRVSPLFIPKALVNMASSEVSIRFGLEGINRAIVTACATGTHCISDAADAIRMGRADVMLAGGSEASVIPMALAGFGAMRALSRRNDEPERASRPFDLDRDGFVMGEGAGILVLESEEHAKARGAEILGVVLGCGESCDAYHITAPREDAGGAVAAMKLALADAKLEPGDIDHFNAHGTSTKFNDLSECIALRTVFGDKCPPVNSIKSMIGHLLGAAGAVEAVACLKTIETGIIPPTINYDTPDPDCQLNLVANKALEAKVEIAMSNSLGFGGHNASLILSRYE